MANDSNPHRKNKQKLHTARYLISRFIWSDESKKYLLDGNSISLLRVMGDIMDATLTSSGHRHCNASKEILYTTARVSKNTATKKFKQLEDQKIIVPVKKLTKNITIYELGTMFLVSQGVGNYPDLVSQNQDLVSQNRDVSFPTCGKPYRYNSNIIVNDNTADEIPKTEEQKLEEKQTAEDARKTIKAVLGLCTPSYLKDE